ncbi:DUF2986 domain-containing protein [Shewanella cyperi]|uniref:DUF2986 domain-containing protein n=1 Tax=Shewanella cyperi TaxID=2814292 RepID=UPI001A93CC59|nr:DUF2986 domain-containing protein [Shewanella cyperi]QSX42191.1 DUF2986 domain-containing protein [Shewanella cyperi]
MNKRQAIIKKLAKRAKARDNKKEKPKVGAKERYISKAERATLEAAEAAQNQAEAASSEHAPDA